MKKTLLIALLMMTSAMLFAGPFGMEFGWSLEELEESGAYTEELQPQGSVTSYFVAPTNTHSLLPYYIVFIDDEYGIVEVRAFSNPCYSEYQVRNIYGMLKLQLSSAYGEPKEIDEISWNSDWDGPENFIRSILYGDRMLMSMWYPEPVDNEASYVFLGTLPNDENSTFVTVEYYSKNFDKVMEKYNASEASVL